MKTHEDRESYWTDLSDGEWNIIEPLVPAVKEGGRPAAYSRREIVNAILYLNRTGCAWRLLPHDLPPYRTVFAYFAAWQADGTWERIEAVLRDRVRRRSGKKAAPTAAIVDSQSVKMADQAGERGRDNGKQVTGRKRHLLVDTLGLILAIKVTAADVTDHAGAKLVLQKLLTTIGFGWVRLVWADSTYPCYALYDWIKSAFFGRGLRVQIVSRPPEQKGFVVQKKRWIIERTFAWLNKCRRLSKDYEVKVEHSEAMIRVASINLMLRRLA
jgi:putative transposase